MVRRTSAHPLLCLFTLLQLRCQGYTKAVKNATLVLASKQEAGCVIVSSGVATVHRNACFLTCTQLTIYLMVILWLSCSILHPSTVVHQVDLFFLKETFTAKPIMGESCCSKASGNDGGSATHIVGDTNHSGHAHNGDYSGHAHNNGHAHNSGGCCNDSDSASTLTETSACCSDQEKCDGKPSQYTPCSSVYISIAYGIDGYNREVH